MFETPTYLISYLILSFDTSRQLQIWVYTGVLFHRYTVCPCESRDFFIYSLDSK
jgi:hypothetical protein